MDLEGNAYIAFGSIYIERSTANQLDREKREFRSLFRPRSAQVLRVLLQDPKRSWKLSQLAEQSGVSIGHVSNVRNALQDREWIEDRSTGIQLKSPDLLPRYLARELSNWSGRRVEVLHHSPRKSMGEIRSRFLHKSSLRSHCIGVLFICPVDGPIRKVIHSLLLRRSVSNSHPTRIPWPEQTRPGGERHYMDSER
jgi:hypothetical protein